MTTPKQPTHLRQNIELKAKLRSLAGARAVATRIATSQLPHQHQIDTYFRCHHGRLKLRQINTSKAQLIAYDRPDAVDSRASSYTITPIAEPTSFVEAMEDALGLLVVVEKRREIHMYHNVRIHLDQVIGLGDFLEFESVLDATVSHAEVTNNSIIYDVSFRSTTMHWSLFRTRTCS